MSADKLKEEGNALFAKKQYGLAALKYTEAIEIDEGNAVLWANRAACRLNTRQFMDAASDSEKATKLDPGYAKAWARLATAHDALHDYKYSAKAWQAALDSLPKENLNASEQKQKEQYAAGLKAAEAIANKPLQPAPVLYMSNTDDHPWIAGRRLVEQYQHTGFFNSSAWLINEAYNDFKEGVDLMKAMKQWKDPRSGQTLIQARLGALQVLVNAIILDKRVFHAEGNFFELYQKQVESECRTVNAWTKTGPEEIMREVPARLASEGWKGVRPALSVTIRAWILRAHFDSGMQRRHDVAVEFTTRAVQLLAWGRETYKNVPKSERGAIFSDTFIIGVRRHLLEALIGAYSEKPNQQTLEDLYEEATQVLKEAAALKPPTPADGISPGFFLGFHRYPKADAHAALGFYHAKLAVRAGTNQAEAEEHWRKSIAAYTEAADILPEDDEQHAWFLNVALEYMDKVTTPLATKLKMYERLRSSIPKTEAIWRMSAFSRGGIPQHYQRVLSYEKRLREGLDSGKWSLSSDVRREQLS
ncbi:hypothetical protein EV715DRAFT_259236 [Schizophyllum commune]